MVKLFFLQPLKHLAKNKLFLFISLACLSIGIAAFFALMTFVLSEYSYDTHWSKSERLYRITQSQNGFDGEEEYSPTISMLALPALKDFYSDSIEQGSRKIETFGSSIAVGNDILPFEATYVDQEFLEVIDLVQVKGDVRQTFDNKNNIALSEESALYIFGTTDVLGETIAYKHFLQQTMDQYTITAIFRLKEGNTSINLDSMILLDEASLASADSGGVDWQSASTETFVVIKNSDYYTAISSSLDEFIEQYVVGTNTLTYSIQPITEIYFNGPYPYLVEVPQGNELAIQIFAGIAVLILGVSLVNFSILSSVILGKRLNELGVRKVVGSSRLQLGLMFFVESLYVCIISLIIAVQLVQLAYGLLPDVLDKEIYLTFSGLEIFTSLTLLVIFIAIVGCGYALSRCKSISPNSSLLVSNNGFTRTKQSLLVFQFIVSITLSILAIVMYAQLELVNKRGPGFAYENLMVIALGGPFQPEVKEVSQLVKREVDSLASVEASAFSTLQPTPRYGGMDVQGSIASVTDGVTNRQLDLQIFPNLIGYDFFDTYGIDVIAGRVFVEDRDTAEPTDTVEGSANKIVINRETAESLGFMRPEQALGALVFMDESEDILYNIIGVVENSQFRDLHRSAQHEVYYLEPQEAFWLSIKYSGDALVVRQQVEDIWKKHLPSTQFSFNYVSESVYDSFNDERMQGLLITGFSSVAVVLALLGLYGVVSYDLINRTNELAIRKVCGATSYKLLEYLLLRFSRPLLIAFAISGPIAYVFIKRWISSFPFQISSAFMLILVAITLITYLVISLLVISNKALRSSRCLPAYGLREIYKL